MTVKGDVSGLVGSTEYKQRYFTHRTNMGWSVHFCFRAMVAVFAVGGVILLSSTRKYSILISSPLMSETNWSPFTRKQLENYWKIPGDSTSLLPLANYSVDLYIDLKKFREQVKRQNKQCQGLKEDPSTMFKSQSSNTTNFTADMDRERIELAFMCGGVLYPEYLKAPPREELYPFEAFYLSEPPLWDESTVASHEHSAISLYGSKTTFAVGDLISLVIKMFDRKGRPRLKGGDRLKVWLKDVKFQHSISANITDFNNGTYLATTVLPWAGSVRVMATLRQPREFFRALAYGHRTVKATIPFLGAYNNSKASEGVPCSPFVTVPGYQRSELCNLTLQNGSPWFCGRPSKRELTCSDYQSVTHWRKYIAMPITPAEDVLLKQRNGLTTFLIGNITLQVEATKSGLTRLPDPNVPCNKVSPRSTWHQSEPTGYFYHKVWKPFLCFVPDKVEQVDESCLNNLNMFFYGDSNCRQFYDRVKSKMQCQETRFSGNAKLKQDLKMCTNKTRNTTIQFMMHSSPFYIGERNFVSTSVLYSPQRLFGSVPSEGHYIITFSHYLHLTSHHLSVYERYLRAMRDEIVKLLKRNPHVLILVRGPHVAEREPYVYHVGDVWAQYIISIQKETFRDLQDRVIYFPTWDITVASEDTDVHPTCNNHLFDLMFHFLCGRDQSS